MNSRRHARLRLLQQARKLARRYPTLAPHWRPYRDALVRKASEAEKYNTRRYAWNVDELWDAQQMGSFNIAPLPKL